MSVTTLISWSIFSHFHIVPAFLSQQLLKTQLHKTSPQGKEMWKGSQVESVNCQHMVVSCTSGSIWCGCEPPRFENILWYCMALLLCLQCPGAHLGNSGLKATATDGDVRTPSQNSLKFSQLSFHFPGTIFKIIAMPASKTHR